MKKLLTLIFVLISIISVAQEDTDSLEAIVRKNGRDVPTARALNLLSSKYARTDPARSLNYAFRAYALAKETGHELTESASLSIFVSHYQNAGIEDSASYYLASLENLASRASGNESDIVKGNYHSTAGLYYKRKGNVKQALPHFRSSIALTDRAGRKLSVAGQSLNLANTYQSLGMYKEALEFYFKALERFEALGNKEGLSYCHQGIGNAFIKLKQFDKAKVYIQKSFELKKGTGDKKGLVTAYVSMGHLASETLEHKKAISYFKLALDHAHALNLVSEERDILFNIGKVYGYLNDRANAEKYILQSKKLAEDAGDEVTRSAAEMELISLRKQVEKKDSSEGQLHQSIARLENMGDADQTLSGYLHLAQFYADKGDFKKAYDAKHEYYTLRDSLKGNEMMMMLRDMEARFNTERKEREIAELKRDQVIAEAKLKEQKAMQYGMIAVFAVAALIGFLLWNRYKLIARSRRQAELEQVRNNIARDLHDDIGSTLSSINILSKVMLDSADTVNLGGLQKIKEHSGNIMDSMGDIVWAINPVNDTFEKLSARMKEFASEILEPLSIRYSFNIDPALNRLRLDPAKKKDIFLIFKESVNNAAKYSGCSRIDISISQSNKRITIDITDDGKGFNASGRNGNGLNNIRARAGSLSGNAEITSEQGKGTRVYVDLPVT